jgi:hypothetical protein
MVVTETDYYRQVFSLCFDYILVVLGGFGAGEGFADQFSKAYRASGVRLRSR